MSAYDSETRTDLSKSTPDAILGCVDTSSAALAPRFDAFELATVDDPYPAYARLRAAGPVCRGGPGQWIVTRYDDVSALLRDQRLGQFQFPSASRPPSGIPAEGSSFSGPAGVLTQRIVAGRDRPEHTGLRRLMSQAFTPRHVEALRERISARVEELLAAVPDGGFFDAVTALAFPLPLHVLCDLLGIPAQDRDELGHQTLRLNKIFAPAILESDRVAADEAVSWLRDRLGMLLRERHDAPRDDVLSAMAAARGDQEEIVDNSIFLLFAGLETSMNMIATECAVISRHPEVLGRIRADRSLVPTAVEEFLRYDTPTQITGRVALESIKIAGRTIRKGRIVLLLLGSANHDERRFTDPERLDVGRDPNPHLSFGGGIHFCLGAALGRLEGAIALDRLVERFSSLVPAGDPERERSATLRAYRSVPLRATRQR
jgi:cytochrome P450